MNISKWSLWVLETNPMMNKNVSMKEPIDCKNSTTPFFRREENMLEWLR